MPTRKSRAVSGHCHELDIHKIAQARLKCLRNLIVPEIKLPASLQTLVYAVDWSVLGTVDLMIRLQTHINLNDNALHVLPDSFLHLEQLVRLLRNKLNKLNALATGLLALAKQQFPTPS